MAANSDSQVVKDVGKWEWSELWKKEDWWAIWLGFFILLAGAVLYFPQAGAMKSKLMDIEAKYSQAAQRTDKFKTIAWYQLYDAKKGVKANSIPAGKFMSTFSKKTHGWSTNPMDAFFMSKEKADAKKAKAVAKYDKAKVAEGEALALAVPPKPPPKPPGSVMRPSTARPRHPSPHGVTPTWRPATPRKRPRPSPTTRSAGSSFWAPASPSFSASA